MPTRRTWLFTAALAATAFAQGQRQPTGSFFALQIGPAHGAWDLPQSNQNGALDGFLDTANTTAYHFTAALVDVPSPCLSCIEGDIQGLLDDGVGTSPDYVVRGHYRGSFFGGVGQFHARIFTPQGIVAVGRIEGTFEDPPFLPGNVGTFSGVWQIAP